MSKNKYIMKRNLLFIVFLCCTCLGIYAAPFRFLETIVTQADGSQLALYASGDEFYHWIHDKDGYTIVQAEDGYCYYAIKNDKGELVPSIYRVDDELPSKTNRSLVENIKTTIRQTPGTNANSANDQNY